jgi:hypothetical protein
MTATIDAPAIPAPRPPAVSPVVIRRLPVQRPVAIPLPPEPVPAAVPDPLPPELPGQPRAEVGTVLRLVLEILDGRRPPSRLSGRLSPAVSRYVVAARTRLNPPAMRRVAAIRGRHGPPGLHTLRLSHPADRVTEASAVWRHRGRFRALAARFEWSDGRWRCTALRLG